MTLYPKELIIATIRDFFSQDTYYSYRKDPFGFPETPDHTDLPQEAGINDSITTRLFVGEANRFDVVFFPCILVRNGGLASVPISINREAASVQWDYITFEDGYGNIKKFKSPQHLIFAGAWEGSINIDIKAKDIRTRDELVDLVSLLFVDLKYDDLVKSGLLVKGVSSQSPSESDDGNNKLFTQSISLQIRSEWRRHIPILNIIEIINTSIEFGRTDDPNYNISDNFSIKTNQSLLDVLKEI
jgi:hypothetical protein